MNKLIINIVAAVGIGIAGLTACGSPTPAAPATPGMVVNKFIDTDAKHSDSLKKTCAAAKKKNSTNKTAKIPSKCRAVLANPNAREFDDYVVVVISNDGRQNEVDVDRATYDSAIVGTPFRPAADYVY